MQTDECLQTSNVYSQRARKETIYKHVQTSVQEKLRAGLVMSWPVVCCGSIWIIQPAWSTAICRTLVYNPNQEITTQKSGGGGQSMGLDAAWYSLPGRVRDSGGHGVLDLCEVGDVISRGGSGHFYSLKLQFCTFLQEYSGYSNETW